MDDGYYGDFLTWYLDEDIKEKVFNVWFRAQPDDQRPCLVGRFSQIIELPDGDILIGFRAAPDERTDGESTVITYFRLSEISFAYLEEGGLF